MFKNKFLKKMSWNLLSNVVYAFSQWIIIIIITKFGDSTMVGQYSLAFSITAPIVLFFSLSLRLYQTTDVSNTFTFNEYLMTRKFTNYLSMMFIGLFLIVADYSFETKVVIFIVGLTKLIDGLSDIVQGDFQLNDNLERASQLKILKSLFLIISSIVSLMTFDSLIYALILMMVLNYFYYYFIDYKLIKKKISRYRFKELRPKISKIIVITWTMGLNMSLSSLSTNIPRIFIEKYNGLDTLGYFTAISYFMLIGTMFVVAVGQATSLSLSRNLKDNNIKEFKKIINKNLSFSLLLGILAIIFSFLFGKEIINLFYNEKTANYSNILIILMFAATFNFATSPYNNAIISLRIMKKQPKVTLITVGISIIFSILLIPQYGIYGASVVILISSIQQLIMKYSIYKKEIKKYS